MDIILHILSAINLPNLILIVIAIVAGIIIGAMPGLSSTFAVAATLPLTFTMEPAAALTFLGAIYMASTYGGSYGAILLNAPGTPQSVTTTFDGYPMARRGDGNLAMTVACVASVIGGLAGILALILIAPPLAKVALSFGPPEFFWLAVLGLTMISSVSEGSLLKGLISGALGLLLSLVGVAIVSGDVRFTFGSQGLIGGISVVPATVGILCLPVIIGMLIGGGSAKPFSVLRFAGFRIREALRISRLGMTNLARSSTIGTIVGIIPAAGGAIASLIAYSAAVRGGRPEDGFRKGNPQGVIASESANNASVGSSLVPTFVLGIPGTPADTVILGAMLIHGLQIGPRLFNEQSDILWNFIGGFLIATILLAPIGLAMGRYAYHLIVTVPRHLLAPLLAMVIMIGAFAIQNSYTDLVIMLCLGIFAWFMLRFGYPGAPMVLGLLLGPIAERGFSQTLLIGRATENIGGMFFGRPVSLAIIFLIVVSLFLPSLIRRLVGRMKT
jgi:putative tricarboxylic transport membrane protein